MRERGRSSCQCEETGARYIELTVRSGPQRKDEKPAAPSDPVASQEDVYTAPLSPQLPIVSMANKPESPVGDSQERPEIEALLMAQRARTPIAVAVASDYSATPFKVPRRAIVLGWFWVTEAWVSPRLLALLTLSLSPFRPSSFRHCRTDGGSASTGALAKPYRGGFRDRYQASSQLRKRMVKCQQ